MLKQIICFSAFLACCSFNLASAQIIAPVANPQIITKEEVLKRPSVSWATIQPSRIPMNWSNEDARTHLYFSSLDDTYIKVKGNAGKAPNFAIHIANEKFIKGKKIYDSQTNQPLGVSQLSKMRFVLSGYDDKEEAKKNWDRLGYGGFFVVDWLMYYDENQNSFGLLASKLYAPYHTPANAQNTAQSSYMPDRVAIENAVIHYKQPPKTEKGKCVRIGTVELRPMIYFEHQENTLKGRYATAWDKWASLYLAAAQAQKAILLMGESTAVVKQSKILEVAENYQKDSRRDCIFYANIYWDEIQQKIGLYTTHIQLSYGDYFQYSILPAH